jgi:hypothetical protein
MRRCGGVKYRPLAGLVRGDGQSLAVFGHTHQLRPAGILDGGEIEDEEAVAAAI